MLTIILCYDRLFAVTMKFSLGTYQYLCRVGIAFGHPRPVCLLCWNGGTFSADNIFFFIGMHIQKIRDSTTNERFRILLQMKPRWWDACRKTTVGDDSIGNIYDYLRHQLVPCELCCMFSSWRFFLQCIFHGLEKYYVFKKNLLFLFYMFLFISIITVLRAIT